MLDRSLTILGGVTDVLSVRSFDVGELAAQGFDDVFGLIETQSCLREVGDAIGIGNGERFYLLR